MTLNTFNLYKAHLESLPPAIEAYVRDGADFTSFRGELKKVWLEPYEDERGYVAELHITISFEPGTKEMELKYLLHPLSTVQPVALRNLSNITQIWLFKAAVESWVYSFEDYERRMALTRTAQIKEELMAITWHPRRVEKLLETCGFEALD